jgi:sec-independent protein translocase protein TatB
VFDIGLGEVAVLIVAALFVFGPDRLPQVIAQAARTIRQIRSLAAGARAEITDAIGPELRELNLLGDLAELNPMADLGEIRDLTPKKMLNDAMFGADDALPAPQPATDLNGATPAADAAAPPPKPAPPVPAFDADAT